jgi:hypothetical protein
MERNGGEAKRNNHIKRNELIYFYLINRLLKESSGMHSRSTSKAAAVFVANCSGFKCKRSFVKRQEGVSRICTL